MRILLDTHIVLWRQTADPRLSQRTINLMDDDANTVEVSAVSVWEVAVKHALRQEGKIGLPLSGKQFLAELRATGVTPLPVTPDHAATVDDLPLHHRDPFDRLLIAQSLCEGMWLLTHDAALAAYGERVIVV